MSVAKCPYCQQTIVGQLAAGDGGWTCPACKRVVGTMVEPDARPGAGSTLVESRPTPFKPEVVREALPAGDGGTVAVGGGASQRTGPGGGDTLIGEVLGGCRILEVLGRGAMGTVYKATQLSLDRTVALKVIREELCTDDDLLQRFQREAQTVGRFSTPHVVQIHDVGREKRVHFIVMEFVSGGSLLAHVNELPGRRLPPDVAIRYMIQAAEGLLEAERLQIVHRDIKPENILLDHAGRVKVADFGISRSLTVNVELTATQAVIGTPLYMSPEQCRAEKVDHRSDMYSLGATFCHLLAGKRPLHEESVQELLRKKTTMEFLSPRRLAQDGSIPESLSRVIERMTALDRADRYPSFKDLLEDLHKVERGELIEPFQRKAARARLRRRLARLAVAAAALAAVGIGGYQGFAAWQRSRHAPPGGDPPATGLTQAQLDAEALQLRAKLREPALLTTALVAATRDKIRRAEDGPDSDAALALQALCDDAERLVAYRDNSEGLRLAPFTPPFAELEARWKRLREIADAARPEASGRELRDFVGRDLEVREKGDQAKATAALSNALADLDRQLKEGLATTEARRDVRRGLDDVVAGRTTLERIFPTAGGAIAAAAPNERTDALREALAKVEATALGAPSDAPVAPAVAEKRLAELKQEFQASGPSRVMEEDAKAMRTRLAEGSDLRAQFGDFLELVVRGNNVLLQLDALRNQQPPAVRPPFLELSTFADKCRGAVDLDAGDPDWYRGYFETEPRRRMQPYSAGARDEFTALVGRWRLSAGPIMQGGGDAADFAQLHQQLDDSKRNLEAAFGASAAFTAELLPEAEFTTAAQEFGKLNALHGRASGGLQALEEAARELDSIHSSAAWRERGPERVAPKLAAARKAIDEVRVTDARAVDAATLAKLAELEGRATRFGDQVNRIDGAIARLSGDHDLAAARAALDGIGASDDPTVKQAKLAVDQLATAFRALFDDLDLGRTRAALGDAQRSLAEAAPAVTYAADCRARLDELEKVVTPGMARTGAGRVRLAPSIGPAKANGTIEVGGFWLDPCEVSIGEFQRFLAELPADRATVERLLPTLPGLAGAGVDSALQKLAAKPPALAATKRPDPRLPIEQVSYDQAIVYLARREKSLPTIEEWWLAAKGSLTLLSEHRRFPWNDSPTARLEQALGTDQVCARLKRPMAVDVGGIAIGFGSVKVHHLSGNVEEWTQAVAAGGAGQLESRVVGGGYDDEEESRFSGEQPRYVDVAADPEFSIGFRGVLRPRDFFAAKGLAPRAY